MAPRTRLFLILWFAAMAGIFSFLLVDLSALIAAIPMAEGALPPELPPIALLKLLSLIQSSVLAAAAVAIGIGLAHRIGLHAPAAEAASQGSPVWPALLPQLLPGVVGGFIAGFGIVLTWVVSKPYLPPVFIERAEEFNRILPSAVRLLYGGLTEEVLLRWGVMTFLVWALWKIFRRNHGPGKLWFVVGIFGSALLFGAGHLPIAAALAGGLTIPVVGYVVSANSLFGIVAGFLYWRFGLESAMIAHIAAHVVLIGAIALAL